ncbi:MAG: beta-aspartyl-peptidase, partial [Desulfobacteraceae bacterium]
QRMLEPLIQVVKETEIPINQFLPTHLTRTPDLLENAIEFALLGGCLDFTVKGQDLNFPITTKQALQTVLDRGISVDQITLSSDSNGSMPIFDEKGAVTKLGVGEINNLYLEWTGLVKEGFSLTDILTMVTLNPAKRTGIHKYKGSLEQGKDADLLILDPDLNIQTVMAKGRLMIHEGKVLVKGTFE